MSSEKGTYPLDEDSPSRQYREEIDSYLPQQGFIPKLGGEEELHLPLPIRRREGFHQSIV